MNARLDQLGQIYYNSFGLFRGDAQHGREDAIFFARELEYIKQQVREKEYPEMIHRNLIPVNFSTDPGAETITYYLYDHVGLAKVISDYAKDFPNGSVFRTRHTSDVRGLGSSYNYSRQDVRRANMANVNLEQREANNARNMIMLKEQRIAYYGDAAYNLGGLFSNANIPVSAVPTDGNNGSTLFSSKTADQIIRDINDCINTVYTQTNGVERADTLLVSPTIYALISSTPRSSTTDTTIMKFIMDNNPFLKEIIPLVHCDQPTGGWASVGLSFTGNIMMAYKRDPDVLQLEIPQDFEQMEPEAEGMVLKVACHERIGGVIVYKPLAMNICENV